MSKKPEPDFIKVPVTDGSLANNYEGSFAVCICFIFIGGIHYIRNISDYQLVVVLLYVFFIYAIFSIGYYDRRIKKEKAQGYRIIRKPNFLDNRFMSLYVMLAFFLRVTARHIDEDWAIILLFIWLLIFLWGMYFTKRKMQKEWDTALEQYAGNESSDYSNNR